MKQSLKTKASNYPKILDTKPTALVSKEHNNVVSCSDEKNLATRREHQVYGDGVKIAHAINSQSLSHLLLINNAPSSTQPLLLLVLNGIHFH